jgi:hypothetical protein
MVLIAGIHLHATVAKETAIDITTSFLVEETLKKEKNEIQRRVNPPLAWRDVGGGYPKA